MLRILDKKALKAKGVDYCNVHLLRLEREGKFPQRFNLTDNRVGWVETEIDAWIRSRIDASRATEAQTDVSPARRRGKSATRSQEGANGQPA